MTTENQRRASRSAKLQTTSAARRARAFIKVGCQPQPLSAHVISRERRVRAGEQTWGRENSGGEGKVKRKRERRGKWVRDGERERRRRGEENGANEIIDGDGCCPPLSLYLSLVTCDVSTACMCIGVRSIRA